MANLKIQGQQVLVSATEDEIRNAQKKRAADQPMVAWAVGELKRSGSVDLVDAYEGIHKSTGIPVDWVIVVAGLNPLVDYLGIQVPGVRLRRASRMLLKARLK